LIKQRKLWIDTTITELVSLDPSRKSFIVQNTDESIDALLYTNKEEISGGLYVYPQCWLQFFKEDDADKQWFVVGGAGHYIRILEIY